MSIAPAMLAGRVAPAALAIFASLIAFPFVMPATPVEASAAPKQCTQWSSTTAPPKTIQVYRVNQGRVETVDFKDYVMRVVSREWNVKEGALREAGAVAVKQYAWYYVLHYRGGAYNGACFDVKDTTADQLYATKSISGLPRAVKTAVNSTWSWVVWRGKSFPMTGYRRGSNVACGSDAGYHLYVRSARKCASQGWSAQQILEKYYSATLTTH
ncbi:MAG TPA: SpoIID/LytB domain-containing protein [Candidatus Limnocylindrales bacterium]